MKIPTASAVTQQPHGRIAARLLNKLIQPEGALTPAGDYVSRIVGWQEDAALSPHRAAAHIASRTTA